MATDEDVVKGLIASVSDPVFIIIPNMDMGDDGYVKLFKTIEEVLSKIEEKTGAEFDILVDDATIYGGYNALIDDAEEQKAELESAPDGYEEAQ